MFVLEYKVKPKPNQIEAINEAIRTTQFVRNKVLRYWMDNQGVGKTELFRYNTALRKEFKFVDDLNSHACQTAVERTLRAITRFYDNCQNKVKGKKNYPKFKKHSRSVEYKVSGWKLSKDKRHITFTDKKGIGTLKLIGSRDINYYQPDQIKRVRILNRADGYYVQCCIKLDPRDTVKPLTPSQKATGIDVGLKFFLVDSEGHQIDCPNYYRKAEKQLNRLNKKKSKKYRKGKKQSRNYHKARKRYARKHLRVSRQREEFVKSVALRLVKSNDLIAYENLNIKGMVKNRHLAKSITDAGWSVFRQWLEYFGDKYGKLTIAVSPHNTSQNCSNCGQKVQKSLSTRTHVCPHCGYTDCRDRNAALNILQKGLSSVGRTQTLNASGEIPSWLVGEIPLANGDSMNEESPSF
ncbi:MAG: transposase [Microcystis aeruginosa K13-05]|uniref:RNA-guided endonuclease InsQ/TnpB family protein n=1 Tax=unclassified Microcystis TaxID=2643300 RepID=UPI0022C72494|nr:MULTISPECIES: transposase [unclassified Microcystis]MCZ8047415.1 transposase [Microcystis sp. LE19-41.2A]MCZ8290641.1 transposase [Microcystis sp. LE19-59.1C]NCR78721.1 transposase [Microcystis aeruginosa K13-10]NCR83851.1 transposase [Microcystis aeruginosa K13-05]